MIIPSLTIKTNTLLRKNHIRKFHKMPQGLPVIAIFIAVAVAVIAIGLGLYFGFPDSTAGVEEQTKDLDVELQLTKADENDDIQLPSRQNMHGNKDNNVSPTENILPDQGMENNRKGYIEIYFVQSKNKRAKEPNHSTDPRFDAIQKPKSSKKVFHHIFLWNCWSILHIGQ